MAAFSASQKARDLSHEFLHMGLFGEGGLSTTQPVEQPEPEPVVAAPEPEPEPAPAPPASEEPAAPATEEHHHYHYSGGGHHHHVPQAMPAPSFHTHAPPLAGGCGLPGPTKFGYNLDGAGGDGGFCGYGHGGHQAPARPATAPAKISTFFVKEKKDAGTAGASEAKKRLGLSGGGGGGGSSVYSGYGALAACACGGSAAGCRSCTAQFFDHLAKKKKESTPEPRWRNYGVPKPPKEEKKPDDPAEDARLVMMRGQHALRQYCSAQRPQTSHGCRGEHNPSTSLSLSESYQRFKSWRDVDGGVTGGATQRGYKKECEGTSGGHDDDTDDEWSWMDAPPQQRRTKSRRAHKMLEPKKRSTCTCNVDRIDTRYGEKPVWRPTSRGSGC